MGFKEIVGRGFEFRYFFQGVLQQREKRRNVAVVEMEMKIWRSFKMEEFTTLFNANASDLGEREIDDALSLKRGWPCL